MSNGSGGFDTIYNEILTTFASIKELGVSNDMIAQQSNLIAGYEFKIRYRQDVIINIGDKIDWRGNRFEIIGFRGGKLNREFIKIIGRTEEESTTDGS